MSEELKPYTWEDAERLRDFMADSIGLAISHDEAGQALEFMCHTRPAPVAELVDFASMFASLCKGLEMDPAIAGTCTPAGLEAIGAAIARQAKDAALSKDAELVAKADEAISTCVGITNLSDNPHINDMAEDVVSVLYDLKAALSTQPRTVPDAEPLNIDLVRQTVSEWEVSPGLEDAINEHFDEIVDRVLLAMESAREDYQKQLSATQPDQVAVSREWIRIEDEAPSDVVFDAYNPDWIDEDFNPEGIRECYRNQGEEPHLEYVSAAFVPMQDCWTESNDRPTHWRKRVGPTEQALSGQSGDNCPNPQ